MKIKIVKLKDILLYKQLNPKFYIDNNIGEDL